MHKTRVKSRPVRGLLGARLLGCMLALAVPAAATAEDTDIYLATTGNTLPNVVFVLDNSANWSASIKEPQCFYKDNGVPTLNGPVAEWGKKVGIEKCALYNVIDALPTAPDGSALYNVGVMFFNPSEGSLGGYVRWAVRPLDAANKALLKQHVAAISDADKSPNAPFALSMLEAYRYLRGGTPYAGTTSTKWDRTALVGGSSAGPYLAPSLGNCAGNHVVLISNGKPGGNEDNTALSWLGNEGGNTQAIAYPTAYIGSSIQANWSDEWARFMAAADSSPAPGHQPFTVHTITVYGTADDPPSYASFFKEVARQGKGKAYAATTVATIEDAMHRLFVDVGSGNAAFASASLPVSVNSRGSFENQVYMGMFNVDASRGPRWAGNLKQYRFGHDAAADSLQLVDAAGQPAVSTETGFIEPAATSFWTSPSDFWINNPLGTPRSPSDAPDGQIIRKGGAAQRLRIALATSQAERRLYTCPGCRNGTGLTQSAATRFETVNNNITIAALGVATTEERGLLIDWVRGADNADDERGPGGNVTVRPSVHGDVLHSRPTIINYGDNRGIAVFYGANDGQLHAIDGASSAAAGGGQELWSFVPDEFYGRLKRLRDNHPPVLAPTASWNPLEATPRDYFVDGPIGVYQKTDASGVTTEAMIFVAMRRGGRFIYAFDVSDPRQPRFAWKLSAASVPLLGQTWSMPRVVMLKGSTAPLVVMGAGYDAAAEDATPPGLTTMGNGVLVLDARTGAVVRTFGGLDRSVAADVTVLDSDADGFVDRAYAVDLGGSVYRLDMAGAPSAWTIYKLAALGGVLPRKFFAAADVVASGKFTAVLVGSGDREKPLQTISDDRFFTLLDRNLAVGMPVGWLPILPADLPSAGSATFDLSKSKGCSLPLESGEKVITAATTMAGSTYFSTNRPDPGSSVACKPNLGVAKAYSQRLFCGVAMSSTLTGGGLPPSPVSGVVTIRDTAADGSPTTRRVPFLIGGRNSKASAIEASRPRIAVSGRRQKLYLYAEQPK